jgi:hypothetical protein
MSNPYDKPSAGPIEPNVSDLYKRSVVNRSSALSDILDAIERSDGNLDKAGEILGVSGRTIRRWIKRNRSITKKAESMMAPPGPKPKKTRKKKSEKEKQNSSIERDIRNLIREMIEESLET